MKVCAVIPTYNNPRTIREVVERVRMHIADVIVVDDGSETTSRAIVNALERDGLARVVRRDLNGGKGAAVRSGLIAARDAGFTYALQIDADGQHDDGDIPKMLAKAGQDVLVLAQPEYDASAPKSRLYGRLVSVFWCMVETMSTKIGDPLCGLRVYPVERALEVNARGDAMDFDPEIAVRLVWAGCAVAHVPSRVRYLAASEGGVSHYRMWRDTLLISFMHSRLCIEGLLRVLTWPLRRAFSRGAA